MPLRVKWSIGQPRLMSTKSAPRDSDQRGSPGHFLGVGAGQLHAEAGLALEAPDQRELAYCAAV